MDSRGYGLAWWGRHVWADSMAGKAQSHSLLTSHQDAEEGWGMQRKGGQDVTAMLGGQPNYIWNELKPQHLGKPLRDDLDGMDHLRGEDPA